MNAPIESPATSPARARSTRLARRLLDSTVGSWLAAVAFVGLPFVAAGILTSALVGDAGQRDLRNLIKVVALLGAYWGYVHWWEHRPVRELSLARALPESAAGLLLGGLLFSAVVAVLGMLGVYALEEVRPIGDLGTALASMLPKIAAGAVIEEVLFRLLLLRLLQRSFGAAWALGISSLAFGLAHLGNTGATPAIGVMLGVELGLLLGAAYLLTRRLWLCAALHLAWNFVQGAVFSMAVSGQSGEGWLRGTLSGPGWLTGGAFGAEGSIVSVMVCLAATAFLLLLGRRQ